MPAKYSHAKKRPPGKNKKPTRNAITSGSKDHRTPNAHVDRSINQAVSAVSQLERAIARILLIRFEQDIARLFSTHLYCVSLLHLPTFIMRCINVGGPGWVAANADCDEIKDFFRSAIGMDLRQAGERVATKSVLWSYTALRHFAMSNDVPICRRRGLHSLRLLPFFPALQTHLDALQAMPPAAFAKPPHLAPLQEGIQALEDACEQKFSKTSVNGEWDPDWRLKIRVGYERLSQTLWRVAREFDVRGYGLVLREKLTSKWCDCGCSTDHLSEVCEKTVREDEEESGVRPGKEREWDGRGSGVFGWETEEEEDIWDVDLDFASFESGECTNADHDHNHLDGELTISQLMEWRYFRAEHEKEQGNVSFKKGDYESAIERYKTAHQVEPEMPHYQLNLAAAYLKLQRWMEAETACDTALSQHKSVKGHWRRAQARKAQKKYADAIKDLRAVLRIQPSNMEAQEELRALLPPETVPIEPIPHTPPIPPSSSKRMRNESPAGGMVPSSSRASGSSSSSCLPSTSSSSSSYLSSSSTYTSHDPTFSQSSSSSSQSYSVPSSRCSTPTPADYHPSPTFSRSTGKQKKTSIHITRTAADNRKLKISALPMTIEVPILPDNYVPGKYSTEGTKSSHSNGKGKGHAHGHVGGCACADDGLDDIQYRPQTFSYLTWERYMVKKVSD
ncbi:hypothetical protein BXZ70DRAFT_947956 [Cristinia sonorae]|uniref:RNA polymerase II-associated protein 3 n=1 Tax=Cristinia sonorae TaxID=1940300 RepID=A0A8K0UJD2_9AGAR|nr:hypothetical protein BXZ70DRAFT_947956 [Cristinia sonorae]